jgi:AraC-like DNA-binding protein
MLSATPASSGDARRVEALRAWLPSPTDPGLCGIAAVLNDDPADGRSLARLRLQHFFVLLAYGAPVAAVAGACGYSGPSAFKHAFGTTPGEYGRG